MSAPLQSALDSSTKLAPAEQALRGWGVAYEKREDGSILVPGNLDISNKSLSRLPDLTSVTVGGNFHCHLNCLVSLQGSPQTVGGDFMCTYNKLESLAGGPQSVGRRYRCSHNALISLEGAAQKFESLETDIGNFASWNEVPRHLAPETKARMELESARAATVLRDKLQVRKPLRFRK